MGLEIAKEDIGNFDKINLMISEKAKDAGMSGRLSGWAMPSSVFVPQFEVELAKHVIDNNLDYKEALNQEFLANLSQETIGVRADFAPMSEELDNYYMLVLDSIYY